MEKATPAALSRGIIIFGSAGAGKTTLGKRTAAELGFPYYDLDDYIWRRDTPMPFSSMYTRKEKADRLMADIASAPHFVMAGSMDSFHTAFDPLFDLAVHLTADTALRIRRIRSRAFAAYGSRVLEGGDLYLQHQSFYDAASRYDTDGSPNLRTHLAWAAAMQCPVLSLNGADALEDNVRTIVKAYREAASAAAVNR